MFNALGNLKIKVQKKLSKQFISNYLKQLKGNELKQKRHHNCLITFSWCSVGNSE